MSKMLTLDYEDEHDYALIGIHASLEDFRLAFYLNSYLNIGLKRRSQDLDFGAENISFSLFTHNCKKTFSSWSLITNKHHFMSSKSLPSGYLFKEEQQTSIFIQEKKQIDYFLKIDGDLSKTQLEIINTKLKGIKSVITSYIINPLTLKSKDFLIF